MAKWIKGLVVFSLIHLDTIITVPYFYLESNPIVLILGLELWVILKILAAFLWLDGYVSLYDFRIIRYLNVLIGGLYLFAVVSNLYVIWFLA